MASSAPEPQPQGQAGAVPVSESPQSSTGDPSAQWLSALPLSSIPDHELLRCIGRGAYGAVWLARNVMGTYRAVKLVQGADFARERPFLREYEGLLNYEPISRSHPNLMQILHVGRRDNYFYYVTELADDANAECEVRSAKPTGTAREGGQSSGVRGQSGDGALSAGAVFSSVTSYVPRTLQEDLGRRGRLPIRECLRVAVALASALKHLHDHKLVHRDVKPSNVIFVHGVPKLADIGLVATVGDSRSIVGTEGYLPPEGPGSAQADLFSLGKMLYEISTGMNRGDYPRLPPNLRELPDAKELLEFNEVLLKTCARDTDRRYHSADELLADLALLERGDSVKRLRRLERHHVLLKRVGMGALVLGLLVSAAWWQSWRGQRIANRNLALLLVDKGTQRMGEGNDAAALPWLVGALQLDSGSADRERAHRRRIASVLERCPVPVAHFSAPNSRITAADLNPDGTVLATAQQDGGVWLWDTRSGERIQQLPHNQLVGLCQFLPSGDRLLTVTVEQQACLWDLARPQVAPLTLAQAMGVSSKLYNVGLNEKLGRVYLSKGRHCFARSHPFSNAFENWTLALKLVGKGDVLSVKYEVRRTVPDGIGPFQGELNDSPGAERFDKGLDDPGAPIWGRAMLVLENGSWGEKSGDSSRVVWDNVRVRRYPSGELPPPWRVLDDFSSGALTNWIHIALPWEGRTCQMEHGQLVLTCSNLPRAQTFSGCVGYREPFEISPAHTLEVEVDLVSAQATNRMVSLSLVHCVLSPLDSPDRPFIAHGRWLATTWWDAPIKIWDLETTRSDGVPDPGPCVPLELDSVGEVWDLEFSPDTNHVAVVDRNYESNEPEGTLAVLSLQTGRAIAVSTVGGASVTGARFSADNRFLAVSHGFGLDLLRTTDWQPALTLGKGARFKQPRFSPRGYRLAAVKEGRELIVWDLAMLPEPIATFPHQANIQRIAFSPDGRYLASCFGSRTVQVWDVVRGEPFGPPLPGALVRFSPDGSQLLLYGDEGGVWLWDLSRVVRDSLAVPPLFAGQSSASSADQAMTAKIAGQGIALRTPTDQFFLDLPVAVSLRRVAFSPDTQYVIGESSDLRAWIWDLASRMLAAPPRSVQFDATLENHSAPNLPVENRESGQLSDLAALLGQQRPDGEGGMVPVDGKGRAQLLGKLKQAHPEDFNVDNASLERWHRHQAEEAEQAMVWDSAVFHWEKVLSKNAETRNLNSETQSQDSVAADVSRLKHSEAQSGLPSAATGLKVPRKIRNAKSEISVEERLAYARQADEVIGKAIGEGRSRWSVILPRQPWATREMLDLGGFYNRPLGERVTARQPGGTFRGLTGGVQVLGGTGFDARGIIHLGLTNHVTIPVGRPCQRLHFLHAASQPAYWVREPVGTYQVTYASGEQSAVRLLNPEDVPSYSETSFHRVTGMAWTNAPLQLHSVRAWSGCDSAPAGKKQAVFLTCTTWELPVEHRGKIVASLELQAGPAASAPLVFAITAEAVE